MTVREVAAHKPEALAKAFAGASGLYSRISHGDLEMRVWETGVRAAYPVLGTPYGSGALDRCPRMGYHP